MSCEAVEEGVEVVSGVGPVEWFRGCVVAVLKVDDAFGELVEVGDTDEIFTNPRHKLTEDYITGRFG